MKCDRCQNEATIHELNIKAGKPIERHLCEQCAKAEGIAVTAHAGMSELVGQLIGAQPQPVAAPVATVCPACGLTLAAFRQTGLLGCPDCYGAFESQLAPLLDRAHEGGTHHVGKSPRRGGRIRADRGARTGPREGVDAAAQARKLEALSRMLDQAVQAEQYERAAALRDEIRRVNEPGV